MNRHNPFSIHAAVDLLSMEYFLFSFLKINLRILREVFLQTRLKLYILLETLSLGSLQIICLCFHNLIINVIISLPELQTEVFSMEVPHVIAKLYEIWSCLCLCIPPL